MGAPNLTDPIWLYGLRSEQVFATVTNGRKGVMPPGKGASTPRPSRRSPSTCTAWAAASSGKLRDVGPAGSEGARAGRHFASHVQRELWTWLTSRIERDQGGWLGGTI